MSKRLLLNRRQKDKPNINLLKKEPSFNTIAKDALSKERVSTAQIPFNNYWDTKNWRQIPVHKSTNHMFQSRMTSGFLRSKISDRQQTRPSTANFFKLKEPIQALRQSLVKRNEEKSSPHYSKTAQSMTKRRSENRSSKDYKHVLASSFGSDSMNPKKFTINDLAER